MTHRIPMTLRSSLAVGLLCAGLSLTGCGAMAELEEENVQLGMRIDSLELANAECGARLSAAAERMSVLEQENVRLDELNRQIAARQMAPPSGVQRDEAALPAPSERGGTVPVQPAVPSLAPVRSAPSQNDAAYAATGGRMATATTQPRPSLSSYAEGITADGGFLTRYQDALNQYNARAFEQAAQMFGALLAEGRRNDMIDNCGYWIGECHYALGRYDDAYQQFSDVIALGSTEKYDDALMMRANTAVRLGDIASARRDFQSLIAIEPASELRARAQQKLQLLR